LLNHRISLLTSSFAARRSGGSALRTLDVWDSHLATAGAELLAGRIELVDALAPLVDKSYAAISGGGGPSAITYRSSLDESGETPGGPGVDRDVLSAALAAALAGVRDQELDRGVTLVGPHRDELVLTLGELPAKGYASHGESWSFALALRLAAYDLLRADGGEPVLILDDVFAELDDIRREQLAQLVAPAEQVLVTAAYAGDVPAALTGARYDVEGGQVTRVR
jgi:DNA replication and repair protein RecF